VTTEELLEARQAEYGDFAVTADSFRGLLHALGRALDGPDAYPLVMIAAKLARLMGNPAHVDSWRDIAGYAELMVRELTADA
jgi:hypothetical protein